MISPVIFYEFNTAGVRVTWMNNDGLYDPSHYTVQLIANNNLTESTVIFAESNRLVAVFAASFSATVNVYAKITVTSKCNQTSDGVFTDTIPITSATDTFPTTSATDIIMITSAS